MHKISIIVPVHNTEKYLRKCVASIQAQTYKNIEIILVENASTDNSLALCHELAKEDDRINVIHLEVGDPSIARNEGIKASTGEFLGFIDSDDTIEPDMYEQMINLAIKEELDIVFCDFVKKYDYRSDRYVFENSGKITVAPAKEILKLNFKDKITQSQCTLLSRKEIFSDIHFPENRFYEDTATTWKLLLKAQKAGHIARPFYHYYRHSGSIVHTPSFKIHYGHVLADIERIDYINTSKEFTNHEKLDLCTKPLEGFYRHFRTMVKLAKTKEEINICQNCRDWVNALPYEYNLRRKFSRIRNMAKNYWKAFWILNRLKPF